MALRLKKDVQKASYYVWFLGAQESKELRGDKVLLSTIPRLIERSRHQENIKVTLQVSHKGLKIIQGSAKHFIPHNAITCSIVKDDIVACVLLLYNPETRCPLHVHAYRLDSELTAHNLNDQLQILIKSPENQKRFVELELKLEASLRSVERSKPLSMPSRNTSKQFDISQRHFDSSLGSDTGTSTRESECSEEQQNSPVERSTHLYDSLAAELRAKLNGNGPPLLLPPRDYDTISRSQGNLTAVDLRRCQNLSIVGKDVKGLKKRGHVSSHGSSGIGSDLAPSPERHEEISNSSSDDWKHDLNDKTSSSFVRKMEKIHISDEKKSPTRYHDHPPSYIFPKDPVDKYRGMQKYMEKSHREQEQPIVVKNQIEMKKKQYIEPVKPSKDVRKHQGGLMRQQSERYRQPTERKEYTRNDHGKDRNYEREHFDRENLTDRQKYREIVESKKYRNSLDAPTRDEMQRVNDYKNDERNFTSSDHFVRTIQRKSKTEKYEPIENSRNDRKLSEYVERNPYRESESLPYRQSIESMMKSPVLKYRSKTAYDNRGRSPSPTNNYLHSHRSGRNYNAPAQPYAKDSSPMSTMKKSSPKDRFQDAKEKFQAMDNIRLKEAKPLGVRRSEPMRYEKDYRRDYSPEPRYPRDNNWSSEEEEFSPKVSEFRDVKTRHDRDLRGVGPAKSLGNLVNIKGYRHSYAEPMKYCNRVGLAAIDPY